MDATRSCSASRQISFSGSFAHGLEAGISMFASTPITAAHRIDEISVFGFLAGSSQIRLKPAERRGTLDVVGE
jgi:hypothetical protein